MLARRGHDMQLTNFKWDVEADGIATAAWDSPGRSMNVLTQSAIVDLGTVGERLVADPAIKGLVITSAKANGFCAGAALDEVQDSAGGRKASSPEEAAAARFKGVMQFHRVLRRF